MKKNEKTIDREHRIVIKQRKVIDYPIIKTKKKKKKIAKENNEYEIIYYSSDEN